MNEIIKIITESPAIYFATVDENNRPNNRPFALAYEKKGQLYFTTSTETSAYKDLSQNPFAAITVATKDNKWIRVTAKCFFTDDMDVKNEVIIQNKFLADRFWQADNQIFELFYLEVIEATIQDYSGKPKRNVFQ